MTNTHTHTNANHTKSRFLWILQNLVKRYQPISLPSSSFPAALPTILSTQPPSLPYHLPFPSMQRHTDLHTPPLPPPPPAPLTHTHTHTHTNALLSPGRTPPCSIHVHFCICSCVFTLKPFPAWSSPILPAIQILPMLHGPV